MFVAASLELLPVILSDIKRCQSQQGDSVSSRAQHSKTVCTRVIIWLPKSTH